MSSSSSSPDTNTLESTSTITVVLVGVFGATFLTLAVFAIHWIVRNHQRTEFAANNFCNEMGWHGQTLVQRPGSHVIRGAPPRRPASHIHGRPPTKNAMFLGNPPFRPARHPVAHPTRPSQRGCEEKRNFQCCEALGELTSTEVTYSESLSSTFSVQDFSSEKHSREELSSDDSGYSSYEEPPIVDLKAVSNDQLPREKTFQHSAQPRVVDQRYPLPPPPACHFGYQAPATARESLEYGRHMKQSPSHNKNHQHRQQDPSTSRNTQSFVHRRMLIDRERHNRHKQSYDIYRRAWEERQQRHNHNDIRTPYMQRDRDRSDERRQGYAYIDERIMPLCNDSQPVNTPSRTSVLYFFFF